MKPSVLVDTSAWIPYFNSEDSEIGRFVERLLTDGRVVTTGVILAELLQGAKVEKELNALLESIVALPFLETSLRTWIRTGTISYSLRRKGIAIPLTDLIIASLALEHDCSVLTLDPHFEKIPEIRLCRSEPDPA